MAPNTNQPTTNQKPQKCELFSPPFVLASLHQIQEGFAWCLGLLLATFNPVATHMQEVLKNRAEIKHPCKGIRAHVSHALKRFPL